MRWFLAVVSLLLVHLVSAANAQDAVWIETEGIGFVAGDNDTESARRRAVADAMLNAALAGGAIVQGHTVVNLARVERDLLIVRPTGRVMQHDIIGQSLANGMWTVRIRALVGNGGLTSCQSPNTLHVTTFAPRIQVSPYAPAWSEPLAHDVLQSLYATLDRHPHVGELRITDRQPQTMSADRQSRDYLTLTRGAVNVGAGDYGFVPEIYVDTAAAGRGTEAQMTLVLTLLDSDNNPVKQEQITRVTKLPGNSILGTAGVLTQNTRNQMIAELTNGVAAAFDDMLSVQSCTPLAATVSGDMTVQVGRRHGLSRGAIAFTADRDNSVEMLEIVSVSDRTATLRPMDPTVPASAFVGRPVRFIEGGV